MLHSSTFPKELAFLSDILGDRHDQYHEAIWLKSSFGEDVWQCDFGQEKRMVIDFRVKLNDEKLLTSFRHRKLLETFKCWLCLQTHFDITGGRMLAPETIRRSICQTLHLIDYFLLNADQFDLASHGLQAINENDLKGLLVALSTSNKTFISIYRWPEHLQTFLRKQIVLLNEGQLTTLITKNPSLAKDIPDVNECLMNLKNDEVVRSRAWLWSTGYYNSAINHTFDYKYFPNTEKLANILYPNTLWGRSVKPIPMELLLEPTEHYNCEYPSIPQPAALDRRLSEDQLSAYRHRLRSLGLLAEIKLPVPLIPLKVLDYKAIRQVLDLKASGRTRTLPQEVVCDSLRNSIEFALEYGDQLVDSYLSLVRAAKYANVNCSTYNRTHDITPFLTKKIRNFGVKTWSISEKGKSHKIGYVRPRRADYFQRFRANQGLLELLRVLYGCAQICVGTIMARRQGEMVDLIAGNCLDKSETRLVFFNRKSGIAGMRKKEARPIPPVAVKLIKQLERLQDGLIDQKIMARRTNLFAYPTLSGDNLVNLLYVRLDRSFEIFCDYFEVPLNANGERYYIRQHQLRRFFAMTFFWGRSFGGMETLRWFLGHTDVEHLYHYITEVTPGEVLRSVKANYATELIKNLPDEAESLASLLEQHYGTRKFSVLDSEELEQYIEELLKDGRVEVEPEFINTPDGQDYRILVTITQKMG